MIANYHTHTWRCNHATGTEDEYVRAALERKFQILGFTDHTPYFFPDGYRSDFRMLPEQLRDYCDTVRGLQKRYDGKIHIPLGLEMEYYPDLIGELLPVVRDAGVEYLLLGQHFIGNEIGMPYSGRPTEDVAVLEQYCRQAMEAMQTGLFTYLAHPDLIHFLGDEKVYERNMRRLCAEAKSCCIPLEVNMLGKWSGRQYPRRLFWELAAEEGCPVVLGCDAHAPDHLKKLETEQQLLDMIRELGLPLLETVTLRKI